MSALPSPDDPMVDDHGRVLLPERLESDPPPKHYHGVPILRTHVASRQRDMRDLPAATPSLQHAIACVIFYRLAGLTNIQIAHALKVSVADVQDIINDDAFQESFEILHSEIISATSASMQAKILHASHGAFNRVVALSESAEKEIVALKASQDILDRSGITAEHNNRQASDGMDGLRIVVRASDGKQRSDIQVDIGKRR